MIPPTPGPRHALKDPRNIRDKPTQTAMRAAIFTWLNETDYDGGLTTKTLGNPSAKDFRGIFMHLVYLLDSSFVFGEKGRKFEDEVLVISKAHQYPFADAIDKKWLTTPSSPFSWPSLLAMLHWVTELSKVCLQDKINKLLNSDGIILGKMQLSCQRGRHVADIKASTRQFR